MMFAPFVLLIYYNGSIATIPMASEVACEHARELLHDNDWPYAACLPTGYPE